MRNLDSCRRWCMLCPCNVRHKFFIHFWNRTILLCMPCIEQLFFNLSARWGGWSTPRSGRFIPRYPLYRRLGGPQGRFGWVREVSPPPGFDPRNCQPVASRYTDWAILAHAAKCLCQWCYLARHKSLTVLLILLKWLSSLSLCVSRL
jgi:hypothetical protein